MTTPAVRENVTKISRCGSVGGCGPPQRQHAVERELIDRLGEIDNPTVQVKPSKYAIPVVTRASTAHRGE